MITDTEIEMDKIFLSYEKILNKLRNNNITTASNTKIKYWDLAQACKIMDKKHPNCRWKFYRKNNKCYVLNEGYYWLIFVYFQKDKKLIDADIDFFESQIKQYEELLKLPHKEIEFKDMYISELPDFFNKTPGTINNSLTKLYKINNQFRYGKNGKIKISKFGIEWLCKNCFKQKYLELLENYKMELTERYMDAGYIYDNF